MKPEQYLLFLLLSCTETKQASKFIQFVARDFVCTLPDHWWVMNYYKILQQSYHLLIVSEKVKSNDPISQYITILLQNINKQQIIPITRLTITKNSCGNVIAIPESKLVLFLAEDEKTILILFHNVETCIPHWDRRAQIIIIIMHNIKEDDTVEEEAIALSLLSNFWIKKRMLNMVIVTRQLQFKCKLHNKRDTSTKVWMYNPFELIRNSTSRGTLYRLQYGKAILTEYSNKRLKNVYGYPLHISMFPQYPTAILTNKSKDNANSYEGLDGLILSSLVDHFNFTPIIIRPTGKNIYGSVLLNGSIEGSLGDVSYGRTEISFNSRFVIWYGTDNIEFSISLNTDKLCIIAPKAKRIPKWKSMLLCFSVEVWILLLLVYIMCAFLFYNLCKDNRCNETVGVKAALDIFQVFILSSVNNPPVMLTQRILFASCLIFSVILMNTFQGLLVTGITSPSYEADIHTLDELQHSSLHILTGSQSTIDILRNGGHSISKKTRMYEGKRENMIKHALRENAAVSERESSVTFLFSKYVSSDGMTLLHMIDECPANFYLAYIVQRGDPYLPEFNSFFRRVVESGLTYKWYWDAIDMKIRLSYKNSNVKHKTLKPFSVSDLQLSFYILVIGLLLSVIIFLAEVLFSLKDIMFRKKLWLHEDIMIFKSQKSTY